jgi:hypothetical protein
MLLQRTLWAIPSPGTGEETTDKQQGGTRYGVFSVMSTLSNVRFSRFGEFEAAKAFTFGRDGDLEVSSPITDDERRL